MHYLVLAVLWIAWCVLHSTMISISVTNYLKRKLGKAFRFYRLTFNMVALLTLVPVAMYERAIHDHWAFWWQGSNVFFQIMLLAVAFLLFFAGARHYDFMQFVGFRQIRRGTSGMTLSKADDLDTTGILGIIRHPWYTGSIIVVWARDLTQATVVTNIILTIYLIVGTYLEERKLAIEYGQKYRIYQQKVPMFIPWKFSKSKTGKGGRVLNIFEDPIKTAHRFSDCIYWNLFILIPLIIACVGIGRQSKFWLIVYLLVSVVVFFVVVLKFFCTHCPHYGERNGSVKCMFYWGVPKYFKARPGPYSVFEQIFTVGSVLFWVILPLFWLCFHGGLLASYVVSLAVLIATLRRYECGRCLHFCCPVNKVPEHIKRSHLQKTP